jgi:hypothetical protein
MTPQQCTSDQPDCLTFAEREALTVLRNHYGDHRDVFTERELTRLRFVRWLYQTGRFGTRDAIASVD